MDTSYLSRRCLAIAPSPSMTANNLAKQLVREGRDIINFTIGEPDAATPDHILEAAAKAMWSGDTHYTDTPGTVALREAIIAKLKRDNGLEYALGEVVVGSGGKHVIYHALAATIDPGDEAIVHAPYWVSYPDMVRLNDGVPVIVEGSAGDRFRLTPDKLAAAIMPKTKWLFLNSPNNPSGAVYSAAELEALAAVLRRHPHVLILSDEIYENFVYRGSHVSIVQVAPDLRDRTLIVNGASKGHAMTGWRIGFGAGPAPLINAMVKLLSQTTSCANSIAQAAAAEAFAGDQASALAMRDRYEERGRLMVEGLSGIDGIEVTQAEGAFYLYADVSNLIGRVTPTGDELRSDFDIVNFLLRSGGVATVAGGAYGMSPYLRLSFATSEDVIRRGCQRIGDCVASLTAPAG